MIGSYIVTGSLEAEICAFTALKAGSTKIMSHPERCATQKMLSSRYQIQSNWIVHSLLIVRDDPLIVVVRVFFSLSLVVMR